MNVMGCSWLVLTSLSPHIHHVYGMGSVRVMTHCCNHFRSVVIVWLDTSTTTPTADLRKGKC